MDQLLEASRLLAEDANLRESLQFDRQVGELQAFRRGLEKQLRDSLRLYPRTELFTQVEQSLEEELERFRSGARRLEQYLEGGETQDLQVGCERVHQAACSLQQLAARLRSQEESWKQQHGTGLAGELKFLIQQTQQGSISYQQAAQALEKSLEACRALEKGIAQSRPETEAVGETLAQCSAQLASFSRSLQRAHQSLRSQHSWEIDERLEDLLAEVSVLGELHRHLMQNLYPPVLCPRCGLQQPGDRAQCGSCSTRLPLPPGAQLQAPPESEARPRFQSFVDTETKVQQWLAGEIRDDQCLPTIEQFLQRLHMGRQQMQRDPALDADTRKLLSEAAESTQRVLSGLRQAIQQDSREECEALLEPLREMEEKMVNARLQATGAR